MATQLVDLDGLNKVYASVNNRIGTDVGAADTPVYVKNGKITPIPATEEGGSKTMVLGSSDVNNVKLGNGAAKVMAGSADITGAASIGGDTSITGAASIGGSIKLSNKITLKHETIEEGSSQVDALVFTFS